MAAPAATVEPAAGGGSCCESLVLCLQKKTFSQEQLAEPVKPPAAVDSPAPEGSPVSDALQTILQRDESEDARELAFLVSTGHCPANVTLTEVDDGDLPALAELFARAPALRILGLPFHGLSPLGVGALAATIMQAAPQLEQLQLGEAVLQLATLRPTPAGDAPRTELSLRGIRRGLERRAVPCFWPLAPAAHPLLSPSPPPLTFAPLAVAAVSPHMTSSRRRAHAGRRAAGRRLPVRRGRRRSRGARPALASAAATTPLHPHPRPVELPAASAAASSAATATARAVASRARPPRRGPRTPLCPRSPPDLPQVLDLAHNGELGAAAGAVLADALRGGALPALQRLHLDVTGLGDAGVAALGGALRAGGARGLTELTLAGNGLGGGGAAALGGALADGSLARLVLLDLSNNGLGVAGAGALALSLRAAAPGGLALTGLRLDDAALSTRAAKLLADALPAISVAAPSLRRLSLLRNQFDAPAAEALVDVTDAWEGRSLSGEHLTAWRKGHALNLAHKKLSAADAILVAASLRDAPHLDAAKHLWLHNNGFGDRGLRALLPLISSSMPALTHLSLNDNGLSDEGGVEAVGLLTSGVIPAVEEFWLSGNQLASSAAGALKQAIGGGAGPKLRNVWLRDNRLFAEHEKMEITATCKARKIFCQI